MLHIEQFPPSPLPASKKPPFAKCKWMKNIVNLHVFRLAGGTFIYITFFEILAQERANSHSNLIQLGAILFGMFRNDSYE